MQGPADAVSPDGSYLRLKTSIHQIEFPDGTVHTFSALENGYLTEMKDPFANWVRVEFGLKSDDEPNALGLKIDNLIGQLMFF